MHILLLQYVNIIGVRSWSADADEVPERAACFSREHHRFAVALMFLVLYSACIGSRTIVRIDEAIRALRRRRLATPPCIGWRIVIERKGPRACVFVGYHAICNGEKLSVVRKILGAIATTGESDGVDTARTSQGPLMADSCWRRWICMCGWPE
jgi:hypothetical protein